MADIDRISLADAFDANLAIDAIGEAREQSRKADR
jgi:hypothetical protein